VASPFSLQLDDKTRRQIARIARRRQIPASQLLREAIVKWVEVEQGGASPYESMEDLIGVARGGDATLSTNTGRRFAQMLRARRDHDPD